MPGNDKIGEEDLVRKRAYELWEQKGQPEDRHEEFWHQALAEFTGIGKELIEETPSNAGSNATASASNTGNSKG